MSGFDNLGKTIEHFVKPKRAIDTVFLHCDASSNPNTTVYDIHQWHLNQGWSGCGYHCYNTHNGVMQQGRDFEMVGAHASGYNTGSLGISLNGLKVSDFNDVQFDRLRTFCNEINAAYGGKMRFRGHREVAAKDCPVFDYRAVLGLDGNGYMTGTIGVTPEPSEPDSKIPMVAVTANLAQVGIGDKHPHVKWLQALLNAEGFQCGTPDGIFGRNTDACVRSFQKANGILDDGIVGSVTWARLIDAGDD
jgi:hypothetical protein